MERTETDIEDGKTSTVDAGDRHRQQPKQNKTKQKWGGGGFNSDCWMDTEKTDWRAFNRLIERQTEGTGKPSSLEAGRRGDKERMVRL